MNENFQKIPLHTHTHTHTHKHTHFICPYFTCSMLPMCQALFWILGNQWRTRQAKAPSFTLHYNWKPGIGQTLSQVVIRTPEKNKTEQGIRE